MSAIETPDETLPVDWVERSDVLPNDWNPNQMSETKREELVHSISDNGWTQPIVAHPETDDIIDGEQRWHAAGHARIKSDESLTPDGVPAGYVPVFYLAVDDTQARVATMQHNVNGETNPDDLGDIFASLDEDGLFYETVERFQIGETGVDRLIERATSEPETPEAFTDDPDTPDDPEPFTESMQFQMTGEEYEDVQEILESVDLLDLCAWAVENNVHSQTRVDMRLLAERDAVYEPGEETIEYPSVDVDQHLRSFYRESDPAEVTEETDE